MGAWSSPPALDAPLERQRARLEDLPAELCWEATIHFYAFIHGGHEPHRMLVVEARNWQIGREVYFVPVPTDRDLRPLLARHTAESRAEAYELHWHEFAARWPCPSRESIIAARRGLL